MVVPGSKKFIPGLAALFNSFGYFHKGKDIGVILLNYDVPDDFITQPWPFELEVVQLDTTEGPAKICKLASYEFVSGLDRVCMLADADFFFLGSFLPFFELAERGYIIGSANGQNIPFKQTYEDVTGIKGIAGMFNHRTIAAPYIVDPREHGAVFKAAVDQWHEIGENHGSSIWMLFNAMMATHGKLDKVVSIPAQQCTNLHQKMLKPGTRVRLDHGRLMTEDGLEVLSVHDKWWRPQFLDGLMVMGEKFAKGDRGVLNRWQQSRDLIKAKFDYWRAYQNGDQA
jgi:hypothetical protein